MVPHPGSAPPPARCWTVLVDDRSVDVEVSARDDEVLGAVLPALAAVLGRSAGTLWSGSTRLPLDASLSHPALLHGAVLGFDRPGPRPDDRSSALLLQVIGGPLAGTTLPLTRGRHLLGRGAGATVPLDDPDVSRRHALVEVGSGTVEVSDLGSTNGSSLDGEVLPSRPVPWPTGAVLRVGTSALTTSGAGGAPATVSPAGSGRLRLDLSAPAPVRRADREVAFPEEPAPAHRRPLPWVPIALPAVAGALMAWVLDTPAFLFFALLSPVVAGAGWWSDRWSGRRAGRRALADYALELAEAESVLADAVRADVRDADAAHPHLASLVVAARRRSVAVWCGDVDEDGQADTLVVRVGTGPGRSRVVRAAPGGVRVPEEVPDLPVVVPLAASGGLGVTGPRARTRGVLAGVLAQLVVRYPPGELSLALLTTTDRLPTWRWLRWLPHLDPAAVDVAADGAPVSAAVLTRLAAAPGRLVVVVDRPPDLRLTAALSGARGSGTVVLVPLQAGEQLPAPVGAVLGLTGETGEGAVLVRPGLPDQPATAVDRLPEPVAAAVARNLAPLVPAVAGAALPRQVRLVDLPSDGLRLAADGTLTGRWLRTRAALRAPIGRTSEGTVVVDLCRAGPHALVAGTTGAGKSELLQTLVTGLALTHPPDLCSFLLVDYKGGAAFAEAAALPHTVGLVSDLDGAATARALRSLTAELVRREHLLSAHGVPDIAALPEEVPLARLVVVVDEFAGLAEELPGFVPGLVGIARRGRSLGIHLVLATQRPSGVVSPEIRANCSLRLCLRTTDESESQDVLGTPQAASLPLDLPGRAYLRAGGEAPVLLQVARVSGTPTAASGPVVRRWHWPPPMASSPAAAPPAGRSDLARLSAALGRHALVTGVGEPHRPWCQPLPGHLPAAELGACGQGGVADHPAHRLAVGLVDRPDHQARTVLTLDLARGSRWLAAGSPRSGRTTLLRTVLAEAVTALGPDQVHVHVLDHGGGALAADAARLPHTGTAVGGDDPYRTVRLVERLTQEVASRRTGSRPTASPFLLLLVDGAESVCAQLDEADPAGGSATLLRLVRQGAAAGLSCVLTTDRAVPGGRLAAVAETRLLLPLADRADYAVAGVPAGTVPVARPPGRALLDEGAHECQLALPRPLPRSLQLLPRGRALSIAQLHPHPVLPLPDESSRAPGRHPLLLPVGPGGDEGAALEVDLARTGGLLICGPPGSGRTTALDAFTRHLTASGLPVLHLVPGNDLLSGDLPVPRLPVTDLEGWRTWRTAAAGAPGVVVVDGYGRLTGSPVVDAVQDEVEPPILLVAGTAAELSAVHRGPPAALRRQRSGLLLLRPGPGDADLLGARVPRISLPARPGSGWLLVDGRPERVQVARRSRPREAAG